MRYLSNAFSLQMIGTGFPIIQKIDEKDLINNVVRWDGDVQRMTLMVKSIVGHEDTAAVLSDQLHAHVPMNRESIILNVGDSLYVAQLTGGRLPEGVTTLPDNFKFVWFKVHMFFRDPLVDYNIIKKLKLVHEKEESGVEGALCSFAREIFGTPEFE